MKAPPLVPEPFAFYLAKNYIAKEGYWEGTVEEATPLLEGCDAVLTYSDGMSFRITCIVDRETNPARKFALSPEQIQEIVKACLKYTGTVNKAKMPASIRIIEVSGRPADTGDLERLSAYKRQGLFSKADISAWHVCVSDGKVWSNRLANGLLAGRKSIEKLLHEPRMPDEALFQPAAVFVSQVGFPMITCLLIAVMTALFAMEYLAGSALPESSLNPLTLAVLGGLNKQLVAKGDWYRLFSSVFLHGGLVHLLMNAVALYLAGSVLEGLIGRSRFLLIFVLGGLGGGLASIALNSDNIVSVGASGAIMGLLAAVFVISFRFPPGADRTQLQMTSIQMLVPSLLPVFWASGDDHVDYANHLGGAVSGTLVALLLMKTWGQNECLPGLAKIAKMIVACWLAVLGYSAFAVTDAYSGYVAKANATSREKTPDRSQATTPEARSASGR